VVERKPLGVFRTVRSSVQALWRLDLVQGACVESLIARSSRALRIVVRATASAGCSREAMYLVRNYAERRILHPICVVQSKSTSRSVSDFSPDFLYNCPHPINRYCHGKDGVSTCILAAVEAMLTWLCRRLLHLAHSLSVSISLVVGREIDNSCIVVTVMDWDCNTCV
jgi:hypothetical protein